MFSVCLVASPGAQWEQQWSYLLSHFQPESLYVIGELDPRVKPFTGYTSVQTAEDVPGHLVLLAPSHGRYVQGAAPITDFAHPDTCTYMFGADNATMSSDFLGGRRPDDVVYIPTDTKDDMYSFMAGAITLYDRAVKRG